MIEEEKEAIEKLESWREFIINNKGKVNRANDIKFYLRTVLNLIQKQQEEIEQKDRQIDLMADTILKDTLKLDTYWCNGCSKTIECPYKNPNKCIVQYFVEQAKEVEK